MLSAFVYTSTPLSIRNEIFSILDCPNKNEKSPKMKTTPSLLFVLSYFNLSLLTYKTILHKITCLKPKVAYLLGRREYNLLTFTIHFCLYYNFLIFESTKYSIHLTLFESYSILGCLKLLESFFFWLKTKYLITCTLFSSISVTLFYII